VVHVTGSADLRSEGQGQNVL